MSAVTAPAPVTARRPALDRASAAELAAREYELFTDQLHSLSPPEWSRPTACPAWDVHALACHVLGMAEFVTSPREQMRQMRAAKRRGGLFIDALTGLQVDEHRHLSPEQVAERMAAVGPRAARGRRRVPGPLRRVRLADEPVDETGTTTESWTLGYLLDVILTRDTWMHRSDVAVATGRPMASSAEHHGRIVADVVAEWAGRHGQPCTLTLTGPAGGRWSWGQDGPAYELDAVQFCRVLAGRGSGGGLLATRVPF